MGVPEKLDFHFHCQRVAGYFLQDEPDTDPWTFDPVSSVVPKPFLQKLRDRIRGKQTSA